MSVYLKFVDETCTFLKKMLGFEVHMCLMMPLPEEMPLFLMHMYGFFRAKILDRECCFVIPFKDLECSYDFTARLTHLHLIKDLTKAVVVLLDPHMHKDRRSRYIEHNVPFVRPPNQMFIPELAETLTAYYKSIHPSLEDMLIDLARLGRKREDISLIKMVKMRGKRV